MMNRREHLKRLAMAASGTIVLPGLLSSCADEEEEIRFNSETKIIVVGAGIAGLAAAKKLKDAGGTVTVLEARNRLGGRIWTDRSAGYPVDLGASWIHGPKKNPISKLASDASATTFVTDDDSVAVYRADGSKIPEDLLDQYDSKHEQLLENYRGHAADSKSLFEALNAYQPDFLDDELLRYTFTAYTEFDAGGPLEQLSSSHWDADEAYGGADVLFPNGYDAVINLLAKDLDIRMEHIVSEVDYLDSPTVKTDKGDFSADYIVVTVPLGVLKKRRISFSPPLPDGKQRAIDTIKMGMVNKVFLEFPNSFWPEDVQYFGYAAEEKGKYPYFLNVKKFAPSVNGLITFGLGNYGLTMEAHSDDQIREDILQALRTMFSNVPEPTKVITTRWSSDEYSYGAYAFMPVNGHPDQLEEMRTGVSSKLFFAGEHTNDEYWGTVHGAYQTGIWAAEDILDAYEASK